MILRNITLLEFGRPLPARPLGSPAPATNIMLYPTIPMAHWAMETPIFVNIDDKKDICHNCASTGFWLIDVTCSVMFCLLAGVSIVMSSTGSGVHMGMSR